MNLRRGFLRITVVISAVVGLIVAIVYPKEPFTFYSRPATRAEKAAAEKWFKDFSEKHPQRLPSLPSGFTPVLSESDMSDWSEEEKRDFSRDLWNAHLDEIPTEYQPRTPVEFAFQFYVFPFALGFLGTWVIYAVLRFLVFGYIVQGFT